MRTNVLVCVSVQGRGVVFVSVCLIKIDIITRSSQFRPSKRLSTIQMYIHWIYMLAFDRYIIQSTRAPYNYCMHRLVGVNMHSGWCT